MLRKNAIEAINSHGILLVFPVDNAKDPNSLWNIWHPRKKMKWEWDGDSGAGVAKLWHLRSELSTSREVIYSKWFRGRATFFSKKTFQALLALNLRSQTERQLSRDARNILRLLEEESPLSTKKLKRETSLVGKALEPTYNRALKELWERALIVGYGEVDEGAFPSLAIGSTRLIFEDLFMQARGISEEDSSQILSKSFSKSPKIQAFYARVAKEMFTSEI